MPRFEPELERRGISLPIYWGNRNWHPMLADTLAEMTADGVKKALAIVLAAYSSYSSCRQYREDIARAQAAAGAGAPQVDKVQGLLQPPRVHRRERRPRPRSARAMSRPTAETRSHVAFTAHSIPVSMAQSCDYEHQLREACRLVAEAAGISPERWALVYQSRSGRPDDPWLGPDILDHLKDLKHVGSSSVLIHPIGFLSDHLEVLYDLDEEARLLCDELGLKWFEAGPSARIPRFVRCSAS